MSADFVDAAGVARRVRALTVHQPRAQLLALGVKRIENRGWSPEGFEPGDFLAIHAGKTFDVVAWDAALRIADAAGVTGRAPLLDAMRVALARTAGIANRKLLAEAVRAAEAKAREVVPFGAAVGVAVFDGLAFEAAGDPWFCGPVGWRVREAVAIEPVPYTGAQGLFQLEAEALAEVRRRWTEARFG